MATYLEQFSSTVKKTQTEQIFKLLSKQRSMGQIRTVEEFTAKLDELVRSITQAGFTPSLRVFPALPHQIIDSDSYNHQLERTEDDLTTAFAEAFNIDQVQRSHDAIVRDVVLKNIRHGIAELDAKISLYEFLNQDPNGFSNAIFSTFRENKGERTTSDAQTAVLFVDPKLNIDRPMRNTAEIDPIGERLVLGFQDTNFVTIRSIDQIFDPETVASAKSITRAGTEIKNMLDDANSTYWVQSILTETNAKQEVIVKLQLNLAGVRPVNFVELEPAHVFPFKLSKIYYLDSTSVIQLLQSPELEIASTVSHVFPTVITSKLILEFTISTKKKVNFTINHGVTLIEQAETQPATGGNPKDGRAALSEVASTPSTTNSVTPSGSTAAAKPTGSSSAPPRRR